MAKLDVVAANMESDDKSYKANELRLAVSVARAADGLPVTGLEEHNFRVACPVGLEAPDVAVAELKWSPGWTKPAGIYWMWLTSGYGFSEGHLYTFGIQVRTFGFAVFPNLPPVIDQGQTVITVTAAGDE